MSESKPKWERRDRSRDQTGLGWLEAEILRVVWDHGEVTVRDVYEALRERRRIAYTTVMAVMGNLAKKGLLTCDKTGVTYLYRAAIPADQVAGEALASLVTILYRGRTGAAAAHLLGLEGELTEEQLEQLRDYAGGLLKS